jgi:hypothetical protein
VERKARRKKDRLRKLAYLNLSCLSLRLCVFALCVKSVNPVAISADDLTVQALGRGDTAGRR